ncbi:hypothetical protein [Streptomyces sp. NPDC002758]
MIAMTVVGFAPMLVEPHECRAAHERLDAVVQELEKEQRQDVRDIPG